MTDGPVIYPRWQPQLKAALEETDPDRLLERVRQAQETLSQRLDKISGSKSHGAEIQAIEDAMDLLEILKRRAIQSKAS